MAAQVTIKSQLDGDLRRFSVPSSCSYEAFCEHVKNVYRLDGSNFTIKYADDEGDLISVTSTEELVEAFRLSKDLTPPILRVTVYSKSKVMEQEKESNEYPPLPVSEWDAPQKKPQAAVVEQPKPEKITQQEEKKEEPKKEEESNEYPPLPVSEWDAPKKKPVLLVNVKIPQILPVQEGATIPISISAQIQNQCAATSAEVSKYATQTMEVVLPLANNYSHLANTIATQCKEISDNTAEMSKRLSALQTEETLRLGGINYEVAELSLATVRECQKLSEATAALCQNLSASTIEDCKRFAAGSNALLVETPSTTALSEDIKGKCGQLSSEVSALAAQTSSEIRRLIMEM